jgi:UDP-N-acetylglucosamine 2-epimerase (non-hydrolysing)
LPVRRMSLPIVDLIVAARPNFMKVAPLWHELKRTGFCTPYLVHTGQHYDANMSEAFFRNLRLPEPDAHLGVKSGSHAEQTGRTMVEYERSAQQRRPALVVVVGDVNATVACSIAAKKLQLPLAHLEAGLRSNDRTMPEEINRLVTDAISDILWTPSSDADENLRNEGHPAHRIRNVGNIMIDSFEMLRKEIERAPGPERYGLRRGLFGVVTLHRPANVDSPQLLVKLVDALIVLSRRLPLIFPVHPRTRQRLDQFGLLGRLAGEAGLHLLEPMSYIDFMAVISKARVVMTDSGGVQEETTYLGIPCFTVRSTTERPITVSLGSNRLVDVDDVLSSMQSELGTQIASRRGSIPPLWDGQTATRVAAQIGQFLT